MRIFLLVLLALLAIYVVGQILRTQQYIRIGRQMAEEAIPFSRNNPEAELRILIAGDSTGVGTGASSPETSLAGLIGKKYPEAEIMNIAVNGSKVSDLISQLEAVDQHFDIVSLHIGGNDNVRFTSYDQLKTEIAKALELASSKADHVLLTTTGNVGTVGLFPAPTRWIFEIRTRKIRSLFMEQVQLAKGDVRYTDLFRERAQDPFAQDPKKYYAQDYFHPSDAGYADWFSFISKELDTFF